MATLVIEVIGAKLLGPFFGNSHFVWTNQILVTLSALATGAWLGGWLADRKGGSRWMPILFLVAGGWLCLLFPVLERANYFFHRLHVGPGAILASGFFYFVPLTALGTAPPLAAAALASDRGGVGRIAGRVFGAATIGGVTGVLVSGAWLIPSFTNEVSSLAAAILTLAVGVVCAVVTAKGTLNRVAPTAVGAVLATVGVLGCAAQLKPREGLGVEIARHGTGLSLLLVMEDAEKGYRYLVDDFVLQNCFQPESGASCASFTHALQALTLAYVGQPETALCVGLGIGVVPMELARSVSRVDAVDIHPGMVHLATEHFAFDPEKVRTHLADGRGYLHGRSAEHDVVILDAFSGDSSPAHLLTREAFLDVREALRPGGVVILNCIAALEPGQDLFARSVVTTMKSVFQDCVLHVSPGGNLFFVAGAGDLEADFQGVSDRVDDVFLERVAKTFENRRREFGSEGIVMTDDFNPIEFHDEKYRAAAREKLAWLMYRN